jgi:hypothetical protein
MAKLKGRDKMEMTSNAIHYPRGTDDFQLNLVALVDAGIAPRQAKFKEDKLGTGHPEFQISPCNPKPMLGISTESNRRINPHSKTLLIRSPKKIIPHRFPQNTSNPFTRVAHIRRESLFS